MADQTITAHVVTTIDGQDVELHVTAHTPEDILASLKTLQGGAPTSAAQAAPAAEPAAQATPQAAPQATPQAAPQASAPAPAAAEGNAPQASAPSAATPNVQPQASAAATAPQAAATPSAESTTTAPALNDVLAVARELLQCSNGEEILRQILTANGAEAVSTAPAEAYPSIIAAINQSLGK